MEQSRRGIEVLAITTSLHRAPGDMSSAETLARNIRPGHDSFQTRFARDQRIGKTILERLDNDQKVRSTRQRVQKM
jgi:hypothetical protein